jgi:predicted extracellular nuclease
MLSLPIIFWIKAASAQLVITPIGNCGDPAVFIHTIQGAGSQSPLADSSVTVEGVVTGDFQDVAGQLGGFFIQEENTDADTDDTTSEGIFVFDNGFGTDVTAGQIVRIQGQVSEQFGLTSEASPRSRSSPSATSRSTRRC